MNKDHWVVTILFSVTFGIILLIFVADRSNSDSTLSELEVTPTTEFLPDFPADTEASPTPIPSLSTKSSPVRVVPKKELSNKPKATPASGAEKLLAIDAMDRLSTFALETAYLVEIEIGWIDRTLNKIGSPQNENEVLFIKYANSLRNKLETREDTHKQRSVLYLKLKAVYQNKSMEYFQGFDVVSKMNDYLESETKSRDTEKAALDMEISKFDEYYIYAL